ncbi:MAG: hypothetical protein ACLFVU_05530 [Phycisphaerae bacterium]
MADRITREQVTSLLDHQQPNSVTIIMPTHPAGAEERQDPIRLKNLAGEAVERLTAAGVPQGQAEKKMQTVLELVNNNPFWREMNVGLAVFVDDDQTQIYGVPFEVEQIVFVGDRFYTTPLLEMLHMDMQFYILALSKNKVRLYHASEDAITPTKVPDMPESFEEAMKFDDPERHIEYHSGTQDHQPASRRPAIYHGQGTGTDDAKEKRRITEYCRMIDSALNSALGRRHEPLLIAATEPLAGYFRETSRYDRIEEETLHGNPDRIEDKQLLRDALAVMKPRLDRRREEQMALYRQLANTDRASDEFEEIVVAAQRGQIDSLFIPRDEHRWGQYVADENRLEIHDQRQQGDQDLLELAAHETARNGGAVFTVDSEAVPSEKKVAATYRYPTPSV